MNEQKINLNRDEKVKSIIAAIIRGHNGDPEKSAEEITNFIDLFEDRSLKLPYIPQNPYPGDPFAPFGPVTCSSLEKPSAEDAANCSWATIKSAPQNHGVLDNITLFKRCSVTMLLTMPVTKIYNTIIYNLIKNIDFIVYGEDPIFDLVAFRSAPYDGGIFTSTLFDTAAKCFYGLSCSVYKYALPKNLLFKPIRHNSDLTQLIFKSDVLIYKDYLRIFHYDESNTH